MLTHAGYELDEEDVRDLLALHERFGVPLSKACERALDRLGMR